MMSHNGFTFLCDLYCATPAVKLEIKDVRSERTAIAKARADGWFIGTIVLIPSGMPWSRS